MLRISQTSGAQIVNLLSKATTEPPESNTAENGTTKGKLRGNGGKETGSRVHLGNQAHLGTLRVRRVDMCVCVGGCGPSGAISRLAVSPSIHLL